MRMGSLSSALRRNGSRNVKRSINKRCMRIQPFCPLASSSAGMNIRCEISSSHAKAKAGTMEGW
eukprot:47960-Eustigmatos_ZCMA.PRE.1